MGCLSVGASPDARVVENALRGKGGVVGWPAPCDTRPCLYIRLPPPAQIVTRLGVGKSPEDAIRDVAEADAQYVLAVRVNQAQHRPEDFCVCDLAGGRHIIKDGRLHEVESVTGRVILRPMGKTGPRR